MHKVSLSYYLNKSNFLSWMDEIQLKDSDLSIKKAAKEIRYEVNGNSIIKPKKYYENLFLKYKFKIITKRVGQVIKTCLYSYDGDNLKLIGLIQGLITGSEQRCCTLIPPTPSNTPTHTPTPTQTPSITPTNTVTPTFTPTNTVTPTFTPTVTGTSKPTPTPSVTVSGTPNVTPTPSISGTSAVTPTPSISGTPDPTPSPSISGTPNVTPTPSVSGTPDPTPTPSISGTPNVTSSSTPPASPSSTPPETPSGTPPETPSSTPPASPSGTPPETPSGTPPETVSSTPPASPSGTPPETPVSTPTASPCDYCNDINYVLEEPPSEVLGNLTNVKCDCIPLPKGDPPPPDNCEAAGNCTSCLDMCSGINSFLSGPQGGTIIASFWELPCYGFTLLEPTCPGIYVLADTTVTFTACGKSFTLTTERVPGMPTAICAHGSYEIELVSRITET